MRAGLVWRPSRCSAEAPVLEYGTESPGLTHFAQDVGDVRFDRRERDEQLSGDLLIGVLHQREHLPLSWSQFIKE